jgi:hypothetical protein
MEDRLTPALYLEMSNLTPDDYIALRGQALASEPGAERVTWWENCSPNRDDLPREIPEFTTLGLVEADTRFNPPAPSRTGDEIQGYLFHRTPRPGQGVLSDRPTLGIELVLVSPTSPERAQEFRDWADFIHIRDIAAANVPHFTMITPYENVLAERPQFMHFYELDTDEAEAAFREMTPATLRHREAYGAHRTRDWANHSSLVIEYVNTFRLLGEI